MRDPAALQALLDEARIDGAVLALRPDYRALLVAVDGIAPEPGDARSEALLVRAEESARAAPLDEPDPHVVAWQDAYRGFGAKPKRTRSSVEALLRRAPAGLPRVNRLTDVYNAVSVLHRVPIGGEDLDAYAGPPRLVRARGDEPFDTAADGEPVVEHPEPGEVVWRDDLGVTCRRWNWRQCRRTRLLGSTTAVLLILDALAPMTDAALHAAADALEEQLAPAGGPAVARRRLLGAGEA